MKRSKEDIERARNRVLQNDDIIERNKEIIIEFDKDLELDGYSNTRRYKYYSKLRMFAEQTDVPFDETDKSDVKDLVLWVMRREDINETTKVDYKKILKRFYRWISDDDEYPECAKWIKATSPTNKRKLPDELLNEEDIKKLIKNCNNIRNKAIISLLWETGARIGEILDLKIKNIQDEDKHMKVTLSGKTGDRTNFLIESIGHINGWLNSHPRRDDKNAPLFVNIGNSRTGKGMQYRAIYKMLNKVADRAEVDKPVNPHQFRHSRATYLASRFTEAQMCSWFGWKQGSDMPGKYVHISSRDTENAYKRIHGVEEADDKATITTKECPRCHQNVSTTDDYCPHCGVALSREVLDEMDEFQGKVRDTHLEKIGDNESLTEKMKEINKIVSTFEKNRDKLNKLYKEILEEES